MCSETTMKNINSFRQVTTGYQVYIIINFIKFKGELKSFEIWFMDIVGASNASLHILEPVVLHSREARIRCLKQRESRFSLF
jgi:hypothetical protein